MFAHCAPLAVLTGFSDDAASGLAAAVVATVRFCDNLLPSCRTHMVNPASCRSGALTSVTSPPLPPEYNIVFFFMYYLGKWDRAPTFRGFLPLGLFQCNNSHPLGQGLTNFQLYLFRYTFRVQGNAHQEVHTSSGPVVSWIIYFLVLVSHDDTSRLQMLMSTFP